MYCNKCGKQISDRSTFCNFCGASQNHHPIVQEKKLPTSYIAVCWITFGLSMLAGCVLGLWGFFSAEDILVYKAMVLVGAACIFIPQVRIKSLDSIPWLVYIVKLAMAIVVFILI